MIPREFYRDYSHDEGYNRAQKKQRQEIKACPNNDGRLLVWNKIHQFWECPSCGHHSQKQQIGPPLQSMGAVSIVTADNYDSSGSNASGTSKPLMRSKYKSRVGESLGNYNTNTRVRGDKEIEAWLSEPAQANTYLVDYKDSTQKY